MEWRERLPGALWLSHVAPPFVVARITLALVEPPSWPTA
jgi:hypothetical protein